MSVKRYVSILKGYYNESQLYVGQQRLILPVFIHSFLDYFDRAKQKVITIHLQFSSFMSSCDCQQKHFPSSCNKKP